MTLDNPVLFAVAAWATLMFAGIIVWLVGAAARWEKAEAFGFLLFVVSLITMLAVLVFSVWLLALGG